MFNHRKVFLINFAFHIFFFDYIFDVVKYSQSQTIPQGDDNDDVDGGGGGVDTSIIDY